MDNDVPFEGTPITLGGRAFVAPPLSFGQIKRFKPVLEALNARLQEGQGAFSLEAIDGMMKLVHAALARNYPELTVEEVEELIDVRTVFPVLKAIMGVSGFVQGGVQAAESAASA